MDLTQVNQSILQLVRVWGGVLATDKALGDALGLLATYASGIGSVNSPVSWPSTISNTSAPIIGSNMSRVGMIIANPGAVDIYVCPNTNGSGAPLAAAPAGAGTILIKAGLMLPMTGLCSSGWNGAAAAAGSNPVTVIEFLR